MWLRVGQIGRANLWPVVPQRWEKDAKAGWKHLEDETRRSRDFSVPLQDSGISPFSLCAPHTSCYPSIKALPTPCHCCLFVCVPL